MSELKACPFCGGNDTRQSNNPIGVVIHACRAIPAMYAIDIPEETWNSRPIEDALRAENAHLRRYVRHLDECDANNRYAVDASVRPTEYAPGPCTCGLDAKGE